MSDKSQFYTFVQTNSLGTWVVDAELGGLTVIEAYSSEEANERAQALGIYFNGVKERKDCECCGDRWYSVTAGDGKDKPEYYGTEITLDNHMQDTFLRHYSIRIHYLDGNVVKYEAYPVCFK